MRICVFCVMLFIVCLYEVDDDVEEVDVCVLFGWCGGGGVGC